MCLAFNALYFLILGLGFVGALIVVHSFFNG